MSIATRHDNDAAFAELQGRATPTQDGRWVVLHRGCVLGTFDSFLQAGWYASEHCHGGEVAIRQLRVARPGRRYPA